MGTLHVPGVTATKFYAWRQMTVGSANRLGAIYQPQLWRKGKETNPQRNQFCLQGLQVSEMLFKNLQNQTDQSGAKRN